MGAAASTAKSKERQPEAFPEEPLVAPVLGPSRFSLDRASPSSDQEESESFQGWLKSSSRPTSEESARTLPMSATDTAGTGGDNAGGGGSGQWMYNRPSADTPLDQGCASHGQDGKGQAQAVGAAAARPLSPARTSRSSSGTPGNVSSPPASVRSSFAQERASLQMNRESLEAFQQAAGGFACDGAAQTSVLQPAGPGITLDMLASALGPASRELTERYALLAVLPAQTPAPVSMLERLWRSDADGVSATLATLAGKGVVNVAKLPGGRVWCLPQAAQLQLLQAACQASLPAYHGRLVDAYAAELAPGEPLASLPDDGYVGLNLGHHLVGAGRLRDLRALLLDPGWLGRKLLTGGTATVVGDFRRYLLAVSATGGDADVKLVLEALQMSAVQAQAHPEVAGLVRCLLVGRLMTARLSPELQRWLEAQRAAVEEDAARAAAAGQPHALQPLTPSLDQAGGLQRLVLRGHSGPVTRVLLAPSGTDAITASSDGTARVWDLEIGDCVLVLEGHAAPITDLAITADSSLLLSTSEDGTARAFELERGQCLRVLAGHVGKVNAVAMDPFGRFVVTAGEDGTARVWDLSSGKAIHVLQTGAPPAQGGALCVALSPCTRFALVGGSGNIAQMWDVVTGQQMGTLAGHNNWVVAVRFNRSGRKAVTASHDGTARVWDLQKGTCRHVLEGHKARLNALTLSDDGRLAATASDDGTARLWDIRTGDCCKVLKGHQAWMTDVVLSHAHDKILTASGDGTAIAYSLDGEVMQVLEGHSGAVLSVALTRKGRFAVTGGEDCTARVFDFTTPATPTPKWHEGRIHCLAARDGMAVATTGDDCAARLWEMESGEFRGLLTGHRTPIRWASFSKDGSRLVTASADRMIRVWEGTSCIVTVPAHQGSRMKSFACSDDASTAAVCLFDSTVTLWDLHSGEPRLALQKWGERDSEKGHSSAVNEVLMAGDGQVVVTLSKDCTARIWSAESGACLHVLSGHTEPIVRGVISHSARLLATFAYDDSVRVWSLETGRCVSTYPMQASISSVALSHDGEMLAVALADDSLWVSRPHDHAAPKCWKGHTAEISGLSFAAHGEQLASCALDGTVRLWDTATGALEALFVSDSNPVCCHVDSTMNTVVAGTSRGVVHFLR